MVCTHPHCEVSVIADCGYNLEHPATAISERCLHPLQQKRYAQRSLLTWSSWQTESDSVDNHTEIDLVITESAYKLTSACMCVLSQPDWFSLVPRPLPSFLLLYWKAGTACYIISHVWHQDRKGGRKGFVVHGCTGPRTACKKSEVTHQASKGLLSHAPSIGHVVA